jgi:hypothetical protein
MSESANHFAGASIALTNLKGETCSPGMGAKQWLECQDLGRILAVFRPLCGRARLCAVSLRLRLRARLGFAPLQVGAEGFGQAVGFGRFGFVTHASPIRQPGWL